MQHHMGAAALQTCICPCICRHTLAIGEVSVSHTPSRRSSWPAGQLRLTVPSVERVNQCHALEALLNQPVYLEPAYCQLGRALMAKANKSSNVLPLRRCLVAAQVPGHHNKCKRRAARLERQQPLRLLGNCTLVGHSLPPR